MGRNGTGALVGQKEGREQRARAGNESYSARGEVMKDFTQGSDSF